MKEFIGQKRILAKPMTLTANSFLGYAHKATFWLKTGASFNWRHS